MRRYICRSQRPGAHFGAYFAVSTLGLGTIIMVPPPLVHWSWDPRSTTPCVIFSRYPATQATPQHCAEQCQEVYGDTTGVIDFDPATTECRCCVGNGTRTSAEKSTYSWSKPCGGPFKPCGDRGVVISDFFIQENTTCTDNTGFQEFTDLTHCAEECTITLEDISVEVVSNSTHCACCKLGSPTEPATGFVINIADCAPVSPPASVPVDDER